MRRVFKPYPTWSIRMEMATTDSTILIWGCETGVGTAGEIVKTRYTKS